MFNNNINKPAKQFFAIDIGKHLPTLLKTIKTKLVKQLDWLEVQIVVQCERVTKQLWSR